MAVAWDGRIGCALVIIVRRKYGDGDRGCIVTGVNGIRCMSDGVVVVVWVAATVAVAAAGVAAVPLQVPTMNTSAWL